MKTRILSAWGSLVLVGLLALPCQAQQPAVTAEAAGKSLVVDGAQLFGTAAVEHAGRRLEALKQVSGVTVVIQTIDSLQGAGIEEATAKAKDSFPKAELFFLIAKAERRISLPVIQPAIASRVSTTAAKRIRDAILARFKQEDFDQGLLDGVSQMVEILQGDTGAKGVVPLLISRGHIQLTLQGARAILAAAEARATEMGLKMNIAVVDDGGHLIAFVRMDGGRPASATTAQTKAISAATFRQSTGPLPNSTNPDLLLSLSVPAAAVAGGPRITPLLGGVPIEVEGQIIGAVGVGGGTGQQDAEVAQAGITALLSDLAESKLPAKLDPQRGSEPESRPD